MHQRILQLIFITVFVSGCVSNDTPSDTLEKVETTNYTWYRDLGYEKNAIEIPFNHQGKPLSYYTFQVYGDTLYLHDQNGNVVLLFNWRSNSHLGSISLAHLVNKNGSFPGKVHNALIIGRDSIMVVQDYRLVLVNGNGDLLNEWKTEDPDVEDVQFGHGQWYSNFPIVFKPQGKVYMQRMHAACGGENFAQCPEYSVESVFDITTGSFDTLPIKFSSLYKTRNYGQHREISRVEVDGNHIFSFESDPNLYKLNLQTEKIDVVNAQSKFQVGDTLYRTYEKEMEMQEILDMYMRSHQYVGLWYDPYQNLIFRFFKAQQPLINENDEFNGISDKELYLMVFNSDLQLLGEIHVGTTYLPWAFVTPEGFMVSKMSPNNKEYDETSLLFDGFKIIQ